MRERANTATWQPWSPKAARKGLFWKCWTLAQSLRRGLSLLASGLSFLAGQEALRLNPEERVKTYLPLRCPHPWSAGQQEPERPHSGGLYGGHLTNFQLKSLRFLKSLKVCPTPRSQASDKCVFCLETSCEQPLSPRLNRRLYNIELRV